MNSKYKFDLNLCSYDRMFEFGDLRCATKALFSLKKIAKFFRFSITPNLAVYVWTIKYR